MYKPIMKLWLFWVTVSLLSYRNLFSILDDLDIEINIYWDVYICAHGKNRVMKQQFRISIYSTSKERTIQSEILR